MADKVKNSGKERRRLLERARQQSDRAQMHTEQATKDMVNLEGDSAMMIDLLHEQD